MEGGDTNKTLGGEKQLSISAGWLKRHFLSSILMTNLGLVLMGSGALTFVGVAAAGGRGDFGVPGVLGVGVEGG